MSSTRAELIASTQNRHRFAEGMARKWQAEAEALAEQLRELQDQTIPLGSTTARQQQTAAGGWAGGGKSQRNRAKAAAAAAAAA